MKYIQIMMALILSATGCLAVDLTQFVDTRIGTQRWDDSIIEAAHEEATGKVYPQVSQPFGMIGWTPRAAAENSGTVPYFYDNPTISGFMGSHYPSGASVGDFGAFEIIPLIGDVVFESDLRASPYSHATEIAKPHFYSVKLDKYNITASMTASEHVGCMEFTYPKTQDGIILIDCSPSDASGTGFIQINPELNQIIGKSAQSCKPSADEFSSYFALEFNKKIVEYGTFDDGRWLAIPQEFVSSDLGHGWKGEYFNNTNFEGEPALVRKDVVVNFDWNSKSPDPSIGKENYSVRWTGTLTPNETGNYKLSVASDDGVRLYVNDKLILDRWYGRGETRDIISLDMAANEQYRIRLEYYQGANQASARFMWITPLQVDNRVKKGNTYFSGKMKHGAYIKFATDNNEVIKVKVAASFISTDQAVENMKIEVPGWDFARVQRETKNIWNQQLGKMEIAGANEEQKTIFYTALYHSLLAPRSLSENGYYRSPYDGNIYKGTSYTDYSIWDTFRAWHPLMLIIDPEKASELIRGLLSSYDEGGWIPKWPHPGYANIMMGTHGDSVVADAYIKGVRDYDIDKAYEALMKNATTPGNNGYVARDGILNYIKYGYVPTDKHGESVARTLEFAYDDYCIAQMAKALGKEKDYAMLMKRAGNYKNVLDPETKLVRGKNSDGSWRDPMDHAISIWTGQDDFGVKSYRLNHTLLVPQDVQGLIDFMGGDQAFIDYLDYFFDNKYYYVGDEFSMHAPYMYNYAGAPQKTQKIVRNILDNYYRATPSGLCGNEDCGQLSAWYIFGALGFYPVCPSDPIYVIGTPLFKESKINLTNGKVFTVKAPNVSAQNIYVKSVTLNGKPHEKSWLKHSDIENGGTLEFVLTDDPTSTTWATRPEAYPPSMTAVIK